MRPVALLAANFVRENRWPILLLFAWITGSGVLFGGFIGEHPSTDDVVFYVRQQALYVVVFAVFLATSAIQNDRRSRRILLVLSKAISRGQYLTAILLGTAATAIALLVATGISVRWLSLRAPAPLKAIWPAMIVVFVGAMLAASLGSLFSTFVKPFIATGLTALVGTAPMFVGQFGRWRVLFAGPALIGNMIQFGSANWVPDWSAVGSALVEVSAFWLAAVLLFARIDITVAEE